MNSTRRRRYSAKTPTNFSQLPLEMLQYIARFLPSEGIKPTRGKITTNYYNDDDTVIWHTNNNIVLRATGKAPNRGIRYELENSPTRPLTERTKKVFANAQKQRGMNIPRIHKNEAAHRFLSRLYNRSQPGPAGVKPAIGITSFFVNGGSNNVEAAGPHRMYLMANFEIGNTEATKGTIDDLMRTSKNVRAALRPGPPKRRKKKTVTKGMQMVTVEGSGPRRQY